MGAWIEARVPSVAAVSSIEMTVGFTRAGESDLFTGNHRVKKVRVLRDGTSLGEFTLDPASQNLQPLDVRGVGGVYRIQVLETQPGSRDDWRELCVSEIRVLGQANGAEGGTGTPEFSVGPLAALPPAPASAEAEAEAETGTEAAAALTEVEARVRQELTDLGPDVASLESVGTVNLTAGEAHVFKAMLAEGIEEMLYLVVAMPGGDDAPVRVLELGTTMMEPGSDFVTDLRSVGPLSVEQGFVRAEIVMRTDSAEYATDGECQERNQAPTVEIKLALVCAAEDCVAIRRAERVVRPGFEQGCRGRRTATDPGEPAYELSVAVEDAEQVRLTLVTGTVPAEELGVIAIMDLPRERATQAF